MTKPLQQIQKENRKFILEAIHGCSYEEALEKEYAKKGNNTISVPFREYEGEELTLSRVLLALPSELYYYKSGNLLYITKPNQNPKEQIPCELKKETLEEQTEETQRAINRLFNN